MLRRVRAIGVGCVALMIASGAAVAQEACKPYQVMAGDNLRNIARAAYNDGDMYRVIYSANADQIGPEADLIEVGATLTIPCNPNDPPLPLEAAVEPVPTAPEVVVETVPAEPAVVAVEPVTEAPVAGAPVVVSAAGASAPKAAPGQKPVGFVTGNGNAPFTDETLAGGGMITQLVEMAVFRSDPALPYTLTFINDWQAHVDALLPSGAYDISFPWTRPDCDGSTMLSAGDLSRCENFVFSDPLYETVEGFFVPADSNLVDVTAYPDLVGKRFCRPEGYTTGMLDNAGLSVPEIKLMRPVSVTDCFIALTQGKTDLVAVDADVADAALGAMGMTGKIVQNQHLTTVMTLHAIAHKSNPDAVAMIGKLNRGITEMYESGEWYDVVSTALAAGKVRQ